MKSLIFMEIRSQITVFYRSTSGVMLCKTFDILLKMKQKCYFYYKFII